MKIKILILGAVMLVCMVVEVRAEDVSIETRGCEVETISSKFYSSCKDGKYRLMSYGCMIDGVRKGTGVEGDINSCESRDDLTRRAIEKCRSKYCGLIPTVIPKPTCVQPPKCAYENPPCSYAAEGVMYCETKPIPTPIVKCIPKPLCIDGVEDLKTGTKLYCDPKPGTVFCTPTPARPTPTAPKETNCRLLKETQDEYFTQCAKAVFTGSCFDIYTSVFQGCSNLGEKNDCTVNNVNAKRNVLCMTAVVEPTKKPTPTPTNGCYEVEIQCIKAPCPKKIMCPALPTTMPTLKPVCTLLGGYCGNLINGFGVCRSGYGEAGILRCSKSSQCCLPDKCRLWSKGDINCSGKIDVADIALWRNERIQNLRGAVGTAKNSYKSDLNNDGVVDMADFEILKDGFLEGLR